jgi:hypothetical protein
MQHWKVAHAAQIDVRKPGAGGSVVQFVRSHEATPLMRAAREHPEGVFGAENCENEALGGAVDRRRDQQAAGRHVLRGGGDEGRCVGDVFDDFQQQDEIETLPGLQNGCRLADPVVDRQLAERSVDAGRGNVPCRRVDAGDARAARSQRFAQQAAPQPTSSTRKPSSPRPCGTRCVSMSCNR